MNEQYYQQSVRNDYEELSDRIGKLKAIVESETYMERPAEERQLIEDQQLAMANYAEILAKRINLF